MDSIILTCIITNILSYIVIIFNTMDGVISLSAQKVNGLGLRNAHGQFGSAAVLDVRSFRFPDDVQRVQTVFGPIGNGRVLEKSGAQDAGQSHPHGKHSNNRR